jgi:general secretion pathway protein I
LKSRGFTLIEVMVAVFIIALGIGALLTTLVSAADTVGYLRDKSFAQWIALNRLSELRLSTGRHEEGVVRDAVEYAGSQWLYEQQISDAGIAGLLRVDVRVARAPEDAGTQAPDTEAEFHPLGSAVGFIGTTPTRGSGLTPDWSPRAPPGPGGEGGPGGDDDQDGAGGRGGEDDSDRQDEGRDEITPPPGDDP